MGYISNGKRSTKLTCSTTAVVAGVLIGASLSGCGSAGDDGEVTLEFWDDLAGPQTTPIYEELITEFEAANPGIKVDYLGLPPGESAQKYNAAITANETPDIGSVTASRLGAILAQDAFLQLDDMYSASQLDGELSESMIEAVRYLHTEEDLYAMPFRGNLELIWYRTDIFEAAGLEAPSTWPEFYEAATALADPATGSYGYTIRGGAGGIFQILTEAFSIAQTESFFDGDGEVTFDSDEVVDHVAAIAELYKTATPEGDLTAGYSEMVNGFAEGKIAMMHHDLFSAGLLAESLGDKVDAIPLPIPDGASAHTQLMSGVSTYGIFAGTEHPEEAWKFVEFLLSAEANSALMESVGSIPASIEAGQDSWTQSQPGVRVAVELLNDPETTTVYAPMYLPDYSAIETSQSEPEYQRMLLGEIDAETFVHDLALRFEESEAAYRSR